MSLADGTPVLCSCVPCVGVVCVLMLSLVRAPQVIVLSSARSAADAVDALMFQLTVTSSTIRRRAVAVFEMLMPSCPHLRRAFDRKVKVRRRASCCNPGTLHNIAIPWARASLQVFVDGAIAPGRALPKPADVAVSGGRWCRVDTA